MCTLLNKYESEQTYERILDEAAHQRRDDAFSFSFFLCWPQSKTASKNVKEKRTTRECLVLSYVVSIKKKGKIIAHV